MKRAMRIWREKSVIENSQNARLTETQPPEKNNSVRAKIMKIRELRFGRK